MKALRNLIRRENFDADSVIFEQGSEGDSVYLVAEGEADVYVEMRKTGTRSIIHTLRPGSIFGEMAVLDRKPRAASVKSVGNLICYRLKVSDFDELKAHHPATALKIYNNLCVIFSERLRAANAMISELESQPAARVLAVGTRLPRDSWRSRYTRSEGMSK